jgi:superfamily I DNA and/or RNA helicase
MEIIQEEIKNMPEWVKSEMNIEEPKWIKFVEGISEDRWYQKSAFLIYSGDLETLKKEGKKLAKKAKLKLGKQNPKSKDSISYSNINPKVQWETTDWSKYMKSIIIQKAPDDELDDIEYEYTMWISIMDAGLIKN